MALADAGTSLDLKNRWSHSEKRMVPLEASVVDAIRAALDVDKRTEGTSFIYNVTTALVSPSAVTTHDGGPPCCDHTHNTLTTHPLFSSFLILSQNNVHIHVLIDTWLFTDKRR